METVLRDSVRSAEPQFLAQNVPTRAVGFSFELPHRFAQVTVPAGEEQVIADRIRFAYLQAALDHEAPATLLTRLGDPFHAPQVQLEAIATSSVSSPSVASGMPFSFSSEHHHTFIPALGPRPQGANVYNPTVAVIDTGWSTPLPNVPIAREQDLLTSPSTTSAPDSYGHGSVVGAIIHDIAPDAKLAIYKVSTDGTTREWTFMAGLVTATADDCDIINASVGFGLRDKSCAICGRDYGTTRSLVFHRLLQDTLAVKSDCIFVAAAGNAGPSTYPTYPARYSEAVCVASTDGGRLTSTFSNLGAVDQDGNMHTAFVLAPGGDRLDQATGTGTNRFVASHLGRDWRGTSFATAYVSGIVADHLSRIGRTARTTAVTSLTNSADHASISNFTSSVHGRGLAQRL